MTVTLLADGTIPRVAIWEGSDDLPWSDPVTYASRTIFHSDNTYLEAFYEHSLTINMAVCPGSLYVTHTLPSHGYAGIPFMVVQCNGGLLPPNSWLQFDPTKYYLRALFPTIDETAPRLFEYGSSNHFAFGLTSNTLPAFTADVTVTLLRPVSPDASPGIDIDPENGVIDLGGYNASSNKRIRVLPSTSGALGSIAKVGPTIDFTQAAGSVGLRLVDPDGVSYDLSNYTGSFAGSGGWPIAGI